jgi:hypothetical protein
MSWCGFTFDLEAIKHGTIYTYELFPASKLYLSVWDHIIRTQLSQVNLTISERQDAN